MSTLAVQESYLGGAAGELVVRAEPVAPTAVAVAPAAVLRRRPSMTQGVALEVLGHAIEYLVDTREHLPMDPAALPDAAAVQILMMLNRAVFRECAEIVPVATRLRNWTLRLLNS